MFTEQDLSLNTEQQNFVTVKLILLLLIEIKKIILKLIKQLF